MTVPAARIVDLGPDDDLFPAWCEVWAAAQHDDRPDDPRRPAREHVALGGELVAPGGSRDGVHRAAVVEGAVAGALRVLLPLKDNTSVAFRQQHAHGGGQRGARLPAGRAPVVLVAADLSRARVLPHRPCG